jgi:hypothetical protein
MDFYNLLWKICEKPFHPENLEEAGFFGNSSYIRHFESSFSLVPELLY